MNRAVVLFCLLMLVCSCRRNETPKPHAYFRIDFPEKAYQLYDSECPFTFDFPVYGKIAPANHPDDPCLFNIVFKDYNSTIHLTYMEIHHNLDEMLDDDWTFVYKKIAQKADAVDARNYADPDRKVYATIYDIKGNAASPVQFFVTDSVRNFIRGSLYFNTRPNYDSLAPAINFFRKDITRFVDSLRWKKKNTLN
jgi:gliding motility-associated lipoprotein GldD